MDAAPRPLPCPFLPSIQRGYTADDIHTLGKDRSRVFYDIALRYAQSLWLEGFPAKALLLVNRALSCHLKEVSLRVQDARPYHAVAWMLQHRPEGLFIGNPRRHYQHLATRMVEPHKPLRTWRAWACWYLAKHLLSEDGYPSDEKQIREESVAEPRRNDIAEHLGRLSPHDDLQAWQEALAWAGHSWSPAQELEYEEVKADSLVRVQSLAHEIWPQVYATIISGEQIHYMLDMMYSLPNLQRELASEGVQYRLIREPGHGDVGFVAWEHAKSGTDIHLHKLYVKPGHHGKGIGARAMQHVLEEARTAGVSTIRLRVNRDNRKAIRAYLREGFQFEQDLCTDIGGGFVMDDHVMVKHLR